MEKIVHLEERDYKNSIKIFILEQKGKGMIKPSLS
jgi:hypothetical protein